MKEKRSQGRRQAAVRASITFPSNLYETLDMIAKQKKVSLAWVVRDAAEKYVESEVKQRRKGRRL